MKAVIHRRRDDAGKSGPEVQFRCPVGPIRYWRARPASIRLPFDPLKAISVDSAMVLSSSAVVLRQA